MGQREAEEDEENTREEFLDRLPRKIKAFSLWDCCNTEQTPLLRVPIQMQSCPDTGPMRSLC